MSATEVPRQTAARGGTARPREAKRGLQRLRDYLDTRRVQRVAIPLIVIVAVIVVASIFLSAAAQRPVTEIVPELASSPPQPTHASIHLNSEPAGAEVIRLTDNRPLGTTPVVDIRPADGRQVNYRFHRAGYTDVQMPFQVTSAGKFELTATLIPVERHSEAGVRSSSSGRHHGHEHKQPVAEERVQPVPVATPVVQPPRDLSPSGLPPLGDRNPIKRLGH